MYRHAELADGCRTLVTTGTGYGTALACHRLGSDLVTSVDVDPYLVEAATDRLASIGLRPETAVCDLTQESLPGEYDRIVSTVSVPNVPPTWLQALRPGGRLVTTITGTGLILYADKTPDGGAVGRTSFEPASFMGPPPGRRLRGDRPRIRLARGEVRRRQGERQPPLPRVRPGGMEHPLHAPAPAPRDRAPPPVARGPQPHRLDDPP
ncbi:hypothetical protein ACFVFF_07710 [Streptomyces sp. NPDC057680]|uniref:hypothetical protein n=1 Tax=Streptomyces sp. NPDC057680 TaxID=3346208 RepID=UPI0036CF348D